MVVLRWSSAGLPWTWVLRLVDVRSTAAFDCLLDVQILVAPTVSKGCLSFIARGPRTVLAPVE